MRRRLVIPLAALKQGENHFRYELAPGDLGLDRREVSENPSFEELGDPVRVELDVVRTGSKVLVNGSVEFRARLSCALCGETYDADFREPLFAEFISGSADDELAGGDGDRRDRQPDDRIEVISLVHDAIHLAVPIAPCCRPDCRGVCLDCGANLNLGTCTCQPSRAG
jgi:uncharacterized protein